MRSHNATHFARPATLVLSDSMPPDLAGVAEIAEILQTTRRTVQRWALRDDFPKPVGELAGGRKVWRKSDIERWAKKRLPLPRTGRPPTTWWRKDL